MEKDKRPEAKRETLKNGLGAVDHPSIIALVRFLARRAALADFEAAVAAQERETPPQPDDRRS